MSMMTPTPYHFKGDYPMPEKNWKYALVYESKKDNYIGYNSDTEVVMCVSHWRSEDEEKMNQVVQTMRDNKPESSFYIEYHS